MAFPFFFTNLRLLIQEFRFETILFLTLFVTKETRQTDEMFFDDRLITDPDPALFFFYDPGRKRRVNLFPAFAGFIAIGVRHERF